MRIGIVVCGATLAISVSCGWSEEGTTKFRWGQGERLGGSETLGSLWAAPSSPKIAIDVGQVRFAIVESPQECAEGIEQCDDENGSGEIGCDAGCQVEERCNSVLECLAPGAACSALLSLADCSCNLGNCRIDGGCGTASDCLAGLACLSGRCSEGRAGCTRDEQCPSKCDEPSGNCVECESDSDCVPGSCNFESGSCTECRADADCLQSDAPVCGQDEICMECRNDTQCAPGQFCRFQQGIGSCEVDNRCLADVDCKGSPSGQSCDPRTNTCVQCTDGAQCTNGPAICSPVTQQCAQCESVDQCGPKAFECLEYFCVECLQQSDCGSAEQCILKTPFGGSCVFTGECRSDSECSADQICAQARCVAELGCEIDVREQIFITNLSVVEDPTRALAGGAWSFGGLMRAMASSPEHAPAFVEDFFNTWRVNQSLNGFTAPARPAIGPQVLNAWPRTPNGQLDLDQSPLTLNAIVNRIDLRNLDEGNAGEGRFVFGVNQPGRESSQQFTLILEYMLPAVTEQEVLQWAASWHSLGELPFPSEQYNGALQAITDRFSGRGAHPEGVNGSALLQLRTNEIALEEPWELREFVLAPATLALEPSLMGITPDVSFNNSLLLAQFINDNEDAVVKERHLVPEVLAGVNFQAATDFNELQSWNAPGINNSEARHKFALNTCSGCHGPEAGVFNFLHVLPRAVGQEARLSGFLTGAEVTDPVTGERRRLHDLERRRQDLAFLVCGFTPLPAPPALPPPGANSGARDQIAVSDSLPADAGLGVFDAELNVLESKPVIFAVRQLQSVVPSSASTLSIRRGIGRVH